MAEDLKIPVELVPMPAMPPITIQFTEAGIMQVAAIIASLKVCNEQLLASLTHVQAVSTQQLEHIRSLEAEVTTLKLLNEMLESNCKTIVGPSGA